MAKKVKWSVGSDEPEAVSGEFNDYDGPVPPKGIYQHNLKKLWLTENKNGDQMIKGLAEIEETGEKKKYNGYATWFNQNVTEQGLPYLKTFLDALGVSWDDFYNKTVTADDEDNVGSPIVKIGRVKIGDNPLRINCKRGSYKGEDKLEVARFLEPKEPVDDDETDEETPSAAPDDDEPPF